MKVNMTPNPLDVVTIHASQGDTEARQWEFELHNNGELIDTSDVKEQLVFKAYKGGTEQILPENTSTPTTSPFLGDIRYPQGLLTDQEFTYRQSPTEEDGNAKITDIKGNTLVWNQQVDISVVPSSSVINGITYDRQTSEIKATGTASADSTLFISGSNYNIYNFINGHSYYLKGCPSGGLLSTYYMSWSLPGNDYGNGRIAKATSNLTGYIYARIISGVTVNNLSFKPQLFDLTSMGIDDLTTPTQVEEWLSNNIGQLPYYAYNQGSLLSFNGNGIKTVGKNLVFKTISNSSINGSGVIISTSNFQMSVARVLEGKEYVITTNDNSKKVLGFYYEEPAIGSVSYNGERVDDSSSYTFTSPITGYVAFRSLGGYSTPMLEFGSVATDYEPYTSSTLSLPISTYFPNGMNGVGTYYDELTNTKATTRMTRVDLGSLLYYYEPPTSSKPIARFDAALPNALSNINTNVKCALYISSSSPVYGREVDKTVCTFNGRVYICDSAYTDATAFKTAMSGVYLVYPLATPTETPITTASLVTENAEIPLSNNDGVLIGKCTEQLSENPGFIDAKIKLSDADGTCYSNKLQLHVERKP